MKRFLFILFAFFILACYGVEGSLDRNIAKVGNRIIWENDVKERAEARNIPYELALLQLIEENLLTIQAMKEKIIASQEEIDERFDFIAKEWKKRNVDFIDFIRKNGLTVEQYKEVLGEEIMREKLVAKIYGTIKITPFEVAKKMAEIPEQKQVLIYRKSFDDVNSAQQFMEQYKQTQDLLKQMEPTGWLSIEKIDHDLISDLYSAGKGNPVMKKQSERFFVYVLAEEKTWSAEERYRIAYQKLKQEKFEKEYARYINNLAKSIPIIIFDKGISEKISPQTKR